MGGGGVRGRLEAWVEAKIKYDNKIESRWDNSLEMLLIYFLSKMSGSLYNCIYTKKLAIVHD